MQSAAAVALSALMLVWPAFWNGYPLIFADTGTYLGQALLIYLGWDRPPFYSVFLFATHWRLTLWGPILAQGLIMAHLLGMTLRVLGRPNPWLLLPVVLALSVLTSLPWLAAQLMPDLFTGVVVLALWLLGFKAESLSRGERLWMLLLATAAIAFHQSHLAARARPGAVRRGAAAGHPRRPAGAHRRGTHGGAGGCGGGRARRGEPRRARARIAIAFRLRVPGDPADL